jgi:protein O-mannosyl-transferase
MVLIAYAPAMRGQFVWDDDAHITKPELQSLYGLYRIWFEVGATQQYYPLLHSAFWVEHKLWGDWPSGYHMVNLALHTCAAMMVMLIMRRLLREKSLPWSDQGAFLTAAVWALHPVQVESVAWITEQKNALSAVFYLAALLAYLRFDRERGRSTYALATVLFALSLLTKPVTVTLPAALLVILWWQRGRLAWRRDTLPLLPWFAMSVISGLFIAWVERDVIGARGEAFGLSAAQRLLLPGRIVWFYLCKLVWPTELVFVYPRWIVDPAVWWQWLFPLAAIALLVVLFVMARRRRTLPAGLLFFIGSLFPVLGFFNVYLFLYTYVADHFQYLPSLGVIALVGGVVAAGALKVRSRAGRVALLLALPVGLGVLTFRQCRMYADIQTLYETTIRKNPGCWMAHNNLGIVLKNKGRREEAIEHYRRALQLRPGYPEAHNNLGVVLNETSRYELAIASYREALRLRPDYPDALGNLVTALTNAGHLQEAIDSSRRLLQSTPDNARFRINLGIALTLAKRHREAASQFEEAVRLGPNLVESHWNLAIAYSEIGRLSDALTSAQRALDLARSSGQEARVEIIRAWIYSRRAGARKAPSNP